VTNDLERITHLEEASWGQKSRALWLRERERERQVHKVLPSNDRF
jgi:hypothetical protein